MTQKNVEDLFIFTWHQCRGLSADCSSEAGGRVFGGQIGWWWGGGGFWA
jgi:hypothetical protein